MEKIIKELPIFWTYIKQNGIAAIHQVKFRGFYTHALVNQHGDYKVDLAVFNIAGRPELFIGYGQEHGIRNVDEDKLSRPNANRKLFNLEDLYPTKEMAEEAAQGNSVKKFFHFVSGHQYEILPGNPLFGDCAWWWGNNTPANMKCNRCSDGTIKLCGWSWDGLKARFFAAFMDGNIEVVDGIIYPNYGHWPLYDMVTCEWVGKFERQYYYTKEECEEANATKVYVFED